MIGIERFRYWQGQMLKSLDFRDQLRYQAQLRAWHNAALHRAFGVVSGLEVSNGQVSCGFGYDCRGRELILPESAPLPPRVGTAPQLLVLLPGKPGAPSTLAWIGELEWNGDRGLPLGRAAGAGGALDPDYGPAPHVRPMARPRLASGETVRGNTPWELWKEGSVDVGVQTRVDTSAAGFTRKPHYFATLKASRWPLASTESGPAAEFAPAYFAHVTGASSDGFTFRLLLQDVALRRYELQNTVARIASLERGAGTIEARLTAAAPFEKGDAVVQVRPRAELAARIEQVEGGTLTVTATMGLDTDDRLVIGNLPRTARVKTVTPETDTVLTLSSTGNAIAGSILARFDADVGKSQATRIARVKEGRLTLRDPWPELAQGDRVRIFHRKDAVKLADAKTEGDATVITLPADAGLRNGDTVIHLTGKRPAPPSQVTAVATSGDTAKVTLKPPIADLKAGANVVASRLESTVTAVDTPTPSLEIELEDDSPFAEHDFVKPAGAGGPAAVVEFADGATIRLRAPATWTAEGDTLVAGNLTGALTVESARVEQGAAVVRVARPSAVRTGYAVARVDGDTALSAPANVSTIPGSEFRIEPAIPQLSRFDTLVAIQFPVVARLAGVVSENEIRIDPAGGLAAGDWIAPLEAEGAFPLAQVAVVNPDGSLRLNGSLGVSIDTPLGQAHFRDTALVASVDPSAKEIVIDEDLEVTAGADFAGRWVYYEDNSSTAVVDAVAGDRLTLKPLEANRVAGEGLIESGPFDAGLLALASISPQQGRLVLAEPPGLKVNDPVTFSGANSLGASVTVPMKVTAAGGTRLGLAPALGVNYSLRPERSSLVSKFNENFPASFAVFAQKQGLYVAWLGCQDEPRTEPECGGGTEDPCL